MGKTKFRLLTLFILSAIFIVMFSYSVNALDPCWDHSQYKWTCGPCKGSSDIGANQCGSECCYTAGGLKCCFDGCKDPDTPEAVCHPDGGEGGGCTPDGFMNDCDTTDGCDSRTVSPYNSCDLTSDTNCRKETDGAATIAAKLAKCSDNINNDCDGSKDMADNDCKFCGNNIVETPNFDSPPISEQCDGSTTGCGPYVKSCTTGCQCEYWPGNLTLSVTTPCVNKTAASRDVTVTGMSNYCGTITASFYLYNNSDNTYLWQPASKTFTGTDPFSYSITQNIPADIIVKQRALNRPFRVDVRGSRGGSDCTIDNEIITITYDAFNYCPRYLNTEETYPDFWIYGEGNYTFYNNGLEYDWDNCESDINDQRCNLQPTSCVNSSVKEVRPNRVSDVDSDGNKEICYSKTGILGGWIDPDVNRTICNAINIFPENGNAQWFSCSSGEPYKLQQCVLGKDTFAPDVAGLCCGDDSNEYPISSNFTSTETNNPKYTSCCSSASSCVDENSICKPEGYEACNYDVQKYAECQNGNWILTVDDACENNCVKCDINSDGWINPVDLTAIQTHFNTTEIPYEAIYDSNGDNRVDIGDYGYCEPLRDTSCSYCGNNITETTEGCDYVDNVIEYNCPADVCGSEIGKPFLNALSLYTREDTCTGICGCVYSAQPTCSKTKCEGSCEVDSDCSSGYSCNVTSCSCEEIPILIPPKYACFETGCDEVDDTYVGTTYTSANCDNACVCQGPGCEEILYGCSDIGCEEVNDTFTGTTYANSFCDNTCPVAPCVKTEDIEVTLTDNIDNDCDGLIDEPIFYNGYGVYIWEQNCNYNLCVYSNDARDHTTKTKQEVVNYSFYNLRGNDLEEIDFYTMSNDHKQINFTSKIYEDTDCIIFNADEVVKYDVDMNGSRNTSNMYLSQNKINPLDDPFYFASPECAKECDSADDCATQGTILFFSVNEGCSYQRCIFDCGGYWINEQAVQDIIWPEKNYGDSCEICQDNMECSNYTNIESCTYNPCSASSTPEGCSWNATSNNCEDSFIACPVGTSKCIDGTCSADCEEDDTMNLLCIGKPNDKCEAGEGCGCIDCYLEQDSCILGAVCGTDEICGCRTNTTLCNDGTCDETCVDHNETKGCIGLPDNYCAPGEGCACSDCNGYQDSCVKGAVCNTFREKCEESIITERCDEGETLCSDWTCDDTCENNGGKAGCIGIANNKCEPGEGCACSDCNNKQDSCKNGNYCNYDYKLCERTATEIILEDYCVDGDSDGYYDKSSLCPGSNDCNDYSASIHPGAIELCNNKDDDCNILIDDNCLEDASYGIDLSLKSSANVRILDSFKLVSQIKNNLNSPISGVVVRLDVPAKFEVYKSTVNVGQLNAGETKEIVFELLVKDYPEDSAVLKMNALVSGSNAVSQDFVIQVEHPNFLIAVEPMFSYASEDNRVCLDFYYSLNNQQYERMDIEFEVVDPASIFGKSVIVDYVSSVEPKDNLIRPMISNPYCLPKGQYEIKGYLYSSGVFKLVDKVEESTTYLDLR